MIKKQGSKTSIEKAKDIIKKLGGIVKTSDAINAGIHPRTFYQLRDAGVLEKLSRGVYKLKNHNEISNPDLTIIATRIPHGIICLTSALSFHEITTEIPHTISIALPKGSETPRIDFPPISIHRFSDNSLKSGIEKHQVDGITLKVYSPEKTLADCFKFRNKIGMEVFLEALKLYKSRKKFKLKKILHYSKICRIEKLIRPYLESII